MDYSREHLHASDRADETTGLQQSIYYAKNVAAGANTVIVTFNKAAAYPDVRILEYSGLDKTSHSILGRQPRGVARQSIAAPQSHLC